MVCYVMCVPKLSHDDSVDQNTLKFTYTDTHLRCFPILNIRLNLTPTFSRVLKFTLPFYYIFNLKDFTSKEHVKLTMQGAFHWSNTFFPSCLF